MKKKLMVCFLMTVLILPIFVTGISEDKQCRIVEKKLSRFEAKVDRFCGVNSKLCTKYTDLVTEYQEYLDGGLCTPQPPY